jgi:hypothetical protein
MIDGRAHLSDAARFLRLDIWPQSTQFYRA